MSKVNVMGVMVDNVTMDESLNKVFNDFFKSDKLNAIFTPNPEFVLLAKEDEEFKNILNNAELVVPDGIGVIYASKIFNNPLKAKVTGCDLTERILERMKDTEYTAYFIGAKGDTAKIAAEKMMAKYPGLKIVGYRDGYFQIEGEEEVAIIEQVNASGADFLVLGMSFPRQEKLIERNRNKLKVKLAIGCGGTLDVLAGTAKRAPIFWQKTGLEWLYRAIKEPNRTPPKGDVKLNWWGKFKHKYRIARVMRLPEFMLTAISERGKWAKENKGLKG